MLVKDTPLGVALLFEWVATHVIAVHLPEARPVLGEEVHTLYPLGALPEVEVGHHQSHGPAVLFGQGLAVVAVSEEVALARDVRQGQVGGVTAVGVDHHGFRVRFDLETAEYSSTGTPVQTLSNLLQVVTQWMSFVV